MTINRIKFIYPFLVAMHLVWFSSACVFQEQVGETAFCNDGEAFSAIHRRCEAITSDPHFPIATLSSVVVEEDAGVQLIELTYSDRNNDPALACEIIDYDEEIDGDLSHPLTCSCANGACYASMLTDKNFHGLSEFHYRIRDKDGRSDIKMVGVEITPVADPPIADMNSMDEEFLYTVINEDQSNREVHRDQDFSALGANASILESRTKTIYLWGSDPDGDVVSDCQIVSHSPYLRVTSQCYCEADIYLNGSLCNVEILAVGNYSGPGEYITYQVYSNEDWSNEETHFIEILPVDDPPLICHYSQYEEKKECTMGVEDECRSRNSPIDSVIKNHTNSRPVFYLDETQGECLRSVKKEDGTYGWSGSLSDRGTFLSGLVEQGSMERIEYPYGAEWISVREDSEVNFFTVQAAFDVDSPEHPLKYYIEDNTYRGVLKSCLSNNISGTNTGEGSVDLECQYDLKNSGAPFAKNLNDDYLTDTVTINNVTHAGSENKVYPTLRFRAKQSGDLSNTPHGRVCVSFVEGGASGNASVSVNSFFMDEIERDTCHNGYSSEETKDECGQDQVSYLEFHSEYPVRDRSTMDEDFQLVGTADRDEFDLVGTSVDVSGVKNAETKTFVFHRCNAEQVEDHDEDATTDIPDDYCECNDKQTDPNAEDYCDAGNGGEFHIHFDKDQTDEEIIVTVAENTRYAINRQSELFEARADELNPAKIWIKHLNQDPVTSDRTPLEEDNRDGDSFTGVDDEDDWIITQEKFTPYWRYDCGDNDGGYGRHIEVKIEDGVTTSQTIKEAIEADSIASALVDVHLYASRKETITPAGLYNEETGEGIYAWPRVLGGGRDYADSMTYYAVDQVTGARSNLGRVYFSIASENDHPYLPATISPIASSDAYEDTIFEFELTPAQDPDFAESLSYMIVDDVIDGGVLSNCANLPGSEGPADLTCTFTPDDHYTGEIIFSYQASDHDGALSEEREVSFNVVGDNDNPTLCQYTTFQDAGECGIEDCIGAMSPVGVITPSSHTDDLSVYYYQEGAGVCWKSTGTSSGSDWEIEVNGNIFDININQSEEVIIRNIRFDEGGGPSEDSQELTIKNVSSSNTDVLPLDNIQVLIGTSYEPLGTDNEAVVVELDDGTSDTDSADDILFYLKIIPIVGDDGTVGEDNRGESTVTITLEDQNTSDNNSSDITVSFVVNVNPIDVNHNGWSKIKALGPKIAGTAYCQVEGVREIFKITGAEAGNTYIFDNLEDGVDNEVFTMGNSVESLSADIDSSPYFSATFVRSENKIIVTNVNYGDADDCVLGGTEVGDCETTTVGVEATTSSQTKDDCEANNGKWIDGEEVLESPYVCSFTEDKCDGGEKCLGSGSPETVYPDQFNAIYRDQDNGSCYRARARYELGNLTLTSRLEGAIIVNVTHDGTKGHEEVIVGSQYGESDPEVSCDTDDKSFFRSGAFAAHVIHFRISEESDDDDLYARLVGDGDMDCEDGDASCLIEVSLNASGSTNAISSGQYIFAPFDVYYAKIDDIIVLTKLSDQKVTFVDNNILMSDPDPDVAETAYFYNQLNENLSVFQRVKYEDNELRVSMNHLGTLKCELTRSINEEDDNEDDRIIKGAGREHFVAVNLDFIDPTDKVKSGSVTSMTKVSSAHYWESMTSYCNVSQSKKATSCSDDMYLGASCIGDFSPNLAPDSSVTTDPAFKDARLGLQIIPKTFNEFFFDHKNNICYRSDIVFDNDTPDNSSDDEYRFSPYVATGTTTLGWEDFGVSTNDVITGYNVYRKLGIVNKNNIYDDPSDGVLDQPQSFDFDRDEPINIEPIASSATEWTDSFETSRLPPVPGTVYFYEVRPIISNVPSRSPEEFSIVRILSPPKNMALVHRWMANKKMCNVMHANERTDQEEPEQYEIDMDENFRCLFTADGAVDYDGDGTSDGYYDIGSDYLVMQVEAGCPYTKNGCTGNDYEDGDCLGDEEPAGTITAAKKDMVYYNRSNGTCYRASNNEGSWQTFNTISGNEYDSLHSSMNFHLPPLVNIDQDKASDLCEEMRPLLNTNVLGLSNLNGSALNVNSSGKDDFFVNAVNKLDLTLPSRLLQIAYSQWDDDYSDSEINTLETGLSLNSTSKCNSSEASGLEDGYTDTEYPAAGFIHTLPGTDDSQIRSLHTGSDYTKDCQTMFGLQDTIGNVSEFSADSFSSDQNEIAIIAVGRDNNGDTVFSSNLSVYYSDGTKLIDKLYNEADEIDNCNAIKNDLQTLGIQILADCIKWPTDEFYDTQVIGWRLISFKYENVEFDGLNIKNPEVTSEDWFVGSYSPHYKFFNQEWGFDEFMPIEGGSKDFYFFSNNSKTEYGLDMTTKGPAPDNDGEEDFWYSVNFQDPGATGEEDDRLNFAEFDFNADGTDERYYVTFDDTFNYNENFESWVIDTESNSSNRMNLALGLPIVKTTDDTKHTFEIGPTSGITSDQLHDDEWIFNTADHLNKASGSNKENHIGVDAAVVSGGSYENGSGAGTWFMELIEQDAGARVDIGFRCVMPILEENYLETQTGTGVGNHE